MKTFLLWLMITFILYLAFRLMVASCNRSELIGVYYFNEVPKRVMVTHIAVGISGAITIGALLKWICTM